MLGAKGGGGGRGLGGSGKSIPPSEDGDMMHAERAATLGHRTDQSGQLKASRSQRGTNKSLSAVAAAVIYHSERKKMAKDLQKEKKFQLRTERFTVSRSRLSRWCPPPSSPQYLNGIQAVILDEFTCIILAITALIWKHVLSAVVAVALFFFSPSQSGDLGALWEPRHCLSTHG